MIDRRAHVLATLQEVVDSVKGLPKPVIMRLMPVLTQAQAEVRGDLMRWTRNHASDATFTAQRYRNALTGIDAALKAAERQVGQAMFTGLKEANEVAGAMSSSHLVMELERFSVLFNETVKPISIDVGAVLAKGDRVLIKRFASSAKRYAGSIGESIVNELAVGRVRGESMFELTDRLQKRLPSVFAEQRSRAWMVARTETQEAYNQHHYDGIVEAHEDDDGILSRWDSSFDSRRCPICRSLDGQVKNIATGEEFVANWVTKSKRGGVKSHSMRVKRPTAHPYCRCVITPWRAEWAKYLRPNAPRDTEIDEGRLAA